MEPGAGLLNGEQRGRILLFVRPVVADPAYLVDSISDALLDSTTAFAADLVDHDRRLGFARSIIVFRAVVSAERRFKRGEEAYDLGTAEICVREFEVLARLAVVLE